MQSKRHSSVPALIEAIAGRGKWVSMESPPGITAIAYANPTEFRWAEIVACEDSAVFGNQFWWDAYEVRGDDVRCVEGIEPREMSVLDVMMEAEAFVELGPSRAMKERMQ